MTRTSVRLVWFDYQMFGLSPQLRIMHYELPNYRIFTVLYQIFVSFAEMVTAEKATVGG